VHEARDEIGRPCAEPRAREREQYFAAAQRQPADEVIGGESWSRDDREREQRARAGASLSGGITAAAPRPASQADSPPFSREV
jgi:hypothetical protein